MRRYLLPAALLAALLTAITLSTGATPATAFEHLRNGDFEQGNEAWLRINAEVFSCNAADGGTAMRLAPTSSVNANLRQRVTGPMAPGPYVVRGRVIRTAGTKNVVASLLSMGPNDERLEDYSQPIIPGSSYGEFELHMNLIYGGASGIIDFTVASGSPATVICLDALTLDGPPPATSTPEPTDTPTITPTAQSTATGSPAPTRTATATPTRTPPPGFTFRNGSFEDGADGWQKFGGELGTTSTPRVSGLSAGVLTSSTTSTKWAYQTVAVDPLGQYQFSGYLQPGPGVASGVLRISWYASSDGSGEAISTTDSTASVSATSTGYVWLTTGGVQPPPGARTARPRVLLAPSSTAEAALFMDDLEFVAVDPATPTVAPPATAAAPSSLQVAPTLAPRVLAANAAVVQSPTLPAPTRVSEVSSTRVVATPPPLSEVSGVRTEPPADDDDGVPLIWIVAAGAFVVGLGGAYLQGRRRP